MGAGAVGFCRVLSRCVRGCGDLVRANRRCSRELALAGVDQFAGTGRAIGRQATAVRRRWPFASSFMEIGLLMAVGRPGNPENC